MILRALILVKMRILLVLLLLLFCSFSGYLKAQHTFEKVISEPKDQIITNIIEDNDGNYIMVGRIKDTESNLFCGYIIT